MRARAAASLCAGVTVLVTQHAAVARATADFRPTWDQVANVKDAAERLGNLHRQRGAKGAFDFIDACYRTHSLAEAYGQAFESCIAQDYLESTMLANLYARMPRDTLRKLGAPMPELLTQSMVRRVSAAFAQYKMPVSYGEGLMRLIDEHGMPVFVRIVLPEAVKDIEERTSKEKKQ